MISTIKSVELFEERSISLSGELLYEFSNEWVGSAKAYDRYVKALILVKLECATQAFDDPLDPIAKGPASRLSLMDNGSGEKIEQTPGWLVMKVFRVDRLTRPSESGWPPGVEGPGVV